MKQVIEHFLKHLHFICTILVSLFSDYLYKRNLKLSLRMNYHEMCLQMTSRNLEQKARPPTRKPLEPAYQ